MKRIKDLKTNPNSLFSLLPGDVLNEIDEERERTRKINIDMFKISLERYIQTNSFTNQITGEIKVIRNIISEYNLDIKIEEIEEGYIITFGDIEIIPDQAVVDLLSLVLVYGKFALSSVWVNNRFIESGSDMRVIDRETKRNKFEIVYVDVIKRF